MKAIPFSEKHFIYLESLFLVEVAAFSGSHAF